MSTVTTIGLVVLSIVVMLVVVGGVARLTLALIRRPLERRIAAVYRPDEILRQDLTANNFGLESWGVWQGRGNGALVLTNETVHFFRFVSGGDVSIPIKAITEVSFTKTHLGKATIYNLLKVRFVVDDKPDSIAWYLSDPSAWKTHIEHLALPSFSSH